MRPRTLAAALLFYTTTLHAQTPQQRYQSARAIYIAHAPQQMFHDGSPDAVHALTEMNSAASDALILHLTRDPNATAAQLEATLCTLDGAACAHQETSQSVLQLAPGVFLATHNYDSEADTIFIVGFANHQTKLLWSIASAAPQPRDPQRTLEAWRPQRAADSCRTRLPQRHWDRCGPLFASIGLLPPDAAGRPRFYIDAEYAEGGGMEAARQLSLWRWTGNHPELLRTFPYTFMIDQRLGTSLAGNILTIAEKHEFHSFQSYSGSEGRIMLHKLRLTPAGVEDLGTVPAYPQLDLVDDLFRRLQTHRPTADIASPSVAHLVRPLLADAGYLEFSSVVDPTHVCFILDGADRLDFTLQQAAGRPHLLQVTRQPYPWQPCPRPPSPTP